MLLLRPSPTTSHHFLELLRLSEASWLLDATPTTNENTGLPLPSPLTSWRCSDCRAPPPLMPSCADIPFLHRHSTSRLPTISAKAMMDMPSNELLSSSSPVVVDTAIVVDIVVGALGGGGL